jgi:hypothetical protein
VKIEPPGGPLTLQPTPDVVSRAYAPDPEGASRTD